MAEKLIYPTEEKVIEMNLLAINIIKVKKSDKSEVLSQRKIYESIEACKQNSGDIYDKAAILLKSLIQKHPFASGNRRTAFIVLKYFLKLNKIRYQR